VTSAISQAQKRVELQNFQARKRLLEYDDVMNQQRKTVYALRRQILEGRYAPELSEADLKAGKEPVIPTRSGEWTLESLSKELRPEIEERLRRFFEPQVVPPVKDSDPPPEPPKPTWRQLRNEIWRQYGALCDIEKPFEKGERDQLTDVIVSTVAASLIQQRERLFDLCDGLIGDAVDDACPPNTHVDEWDYDKLAATLTELFNAKLKVDRRLQDREELAEAIWGDLEALLKKRQVELTTPFFLYYARHSFLEEIDSQWIDHLKAMEQLREGIGLRGYGQKDPKQEYKKEGFAIFSEMMANIQRNVCQKVFRVQIARPEEEIPLLQAKQRQLVAYHPGDGQGSGTGHAATQAAVVAGAQAGAAAAGGAAAAAGGGGKPQTVRRAEPKVGRNDPCPCGSGKKYKKCHGAQAAPEA
jgi:preprotein translocase subunit SecA